MRGVRELESRTRTTAYLGVYERDASLRAEFREIAGIGAVARSSRPPPTSDRPAVAERAARHRAPRRAVRGARRPRRGRPRRPPGRPLRRAYDGDLAIPLRDDRPTVIANFVETLDGAVALDRDGHSGGGAVSGFSPTDRFVMGLLRAMADVVLVGAGTVRASSGTGWTPARAYPQAADAYRELRQRLGLAPEPTDAHRDRARATSTRAIRRSGTPDRPIVIAAPPATAERLRGLGFRDGIRIEALGEGDRVSPAALVDLAGRLGARVVLTEGGPHVLAGLTTAGLLDELFLDPRSAAGRSRRHARSAWRSSRASRWMPRPRGGAGWRRSDVGGDHLFLRYSFGLDGSSLNTTQQ